MINTPARQQFAREIAAKFETPVEDADKAIEALLCFLKFRQDVVDLFARLPQPQKQEAPVELTPEGHPKTLGVRVQDTIKTRDKVGG